MLQIGEKVVNEPLNHTELNITYEKYTFNCRVTKGYGTDQPVSYIFDFEDGSSLLYDKSNQAIYPMCNFGIAIEMTLEKANEIYNSRLKRLMLQSKNKYIARGMYADYNDHNGSTFY